MENEGWGGGWDLNPQTSGQTRDFQSLARTNEQATTVGQQEKTRARLLPEAPVAASPFPFGGDLFRIKTNRRHFIVLVTFFRLKEKTGSTGLWGCNPLRPDLLTSSHRTHLN